MHGLELLLETPRGGTAFPLGKAPAFADVAVVGVSHRTTDTRGLADFAREPAARRRVALELARLGLREVMILTTCNRVEVLYTHGGDGEARLLAGRVLAAAALHGGARPIPPHFAFDGAEAVEHLFEVATSIDSLVVGETQIVRQLRDAAMDAESWGTFGPRLRGLTAEAFRVARQARRSAGLCRGASVVSLAADRIAAAARGAAGLPVAVVGCGDMGEQAAAALEKRRVAGVLFVNRSVGRARGLAERSGGRAMTLDAFLSDPPAVAAVLTATSSPSSLFGPAEARRLLEARRAAGASGPLVFADLAVPADVDPALRGCQEIDITGIDDLRSAAAERERAQRDGVARTRAILTARLRRLRDRESRRGEGLAFARARARAEDAARRAAAELRAGLSELDSAAAARIERWAAEASHRMAHAAKRGGLDAALALAPAEEARLGGILTRAHGAAAAAWFPRAALAIARAAAGAAATGA